MFYISKEQSDINFYTVKDLLAQSYWADKRSEDIIKKSIENSLCYGAYLKESNNQIGFARVITDYATTYYICDVIVDKEYRGNGVGKTLIDAITNDDRLQNMSGMLVTLDAHGLYEQFGFCKVENRYMRR